MAGVSKNAERSRAGNSREVRTVILGVTASDAHAVANHLIAHSLRDEGFHVVNLGVNTSVEEFFAALRENPDAEAIVIGSINGHAYEDLLDLPEERAQTGIDCPVVLGGNLSVGSHKTDDHLQRLYDLGVDHILQDADEIVALLDKLLAARTADGVETTVHAAGEDARP
ncbi:MAG TPA: cobalamin-dependent protein [Yinghuangia sp.]|uniref:cobalamin-dependent protein n=1 Tax=Yinghuangia sp. YIM S10712 TaxID=3436930 RepID=UPI002C5E4BFF|nr:cobalamin-dependent protein [Yinghuangia sp.]